MDKTDLMRMVRFRPYRKGYGPTFTLKLYWLGKEQIGYSLEMHDKQTTLLFEGSDFGPSPMHSVDGDDAVKALMNFLTLRLGDTDSEYFANYTPAQLEFCTLHAEMLSMEVINRFGE
jgi:hypothetical protein